MREEKIMFSNSRGDKLSGLLHHPENSTPRGAVILCHGMESNKNSEKLVFLSRELAQREILALRFDFLCAREFDGKFEDITYGGEVEDLKAAYTLLGHYNSGKTAIFGSSMGGTVALMFAAQEPTVSALVTLAAPLHPEKFPYRILTLAQLKAWRERGFILYNGRRLNVSLLLELENIDVPACARKIACPVLILHGDADDVVPVEEAYELRGCLANSNELSILKGADHRLSNPEMMRRALGEAVDWLTMHFQ
jgi:pimeloyl-ACP methyl ester carboxylesterase